MRLRYLQRFGVCWFFRNSWIYFFFEICGACTVIIISNRCGVFTLRNIADRVTVCTFALSH